MTHQIMTDQIRIAVTGTPGSGKSTLARTIARKLDIPYIEADNLRWGPDWYVRSDDELRTMAQEQLQAPCWLFDGNYIVLREMAWPLCNIIIWLDYPIAVVWWRLLCRTLRRLFRGEVLWNGNRERWTYQLRMLRTFFVPIIRSHFAKRREYPALLSKYSDATIVVLHTPKEAQQWLESFLRH